MNRIILAAVSKTLAKAFVEWILPENGDSGNGDNNEQVSRKSLNDYLEESLLLFPIIGVHGLLWREIYNGIRRYKASDRYEVKIDAKAEVVSKLQRMIENDQRFAEYALSELDKVYDEYKNKVELSESNSSEAQRNAFRNIKLIESIEL